MIITPITVLRPNFPGIAPGYALPAGPTGPSAYQAALDNGFVGTEAQWLASLVGAAGPEGPRGPAGPTGPTGPSGSGTVIGFATDADVEALTPDVAMDPPHTLDMIEQSQAATAFLSSVAMPNQFVATTSYPTDSGGGGSVPTLRGLSVQDLGFNLARDGTARYPRAPTDVWRDFRTFGWYINPKSWWDSTSSLKASIANEDVYFITNPGVIYLTGPIPFAPAKRVTIVSLCNDGVPTLRQMDPTNGFFDFSNSTSYVKFVGKFRFVYPIPAGPSVVAFNFASAKHVEFEDFTVDGAGIPFFMSATTGIKGRSFKARNMTGDGMQLISGADLQVDHWHFEGGAARGAYIAPGWAGGFRARSFVAKNNQLQGLEYASQGMLDQIDDIRLSGNGLASAGTYDGLKIDATARNLRILGGEIGQTADWGKAAGTIACTITVPGDTLTINGTTLTGLNTGTPSGAQFRTGSTAHAAYLYLLQALQGSADANLSACTYTGNSATNAITISYNIPGTVGNSVAMSTTAAGLALSGSTLSGGVGLITQANGVSIANGATHIAIGASLIGNTNPALNNAAAGAQVSLTGWTS